VAANTSTTAAALADLVKEELPPGIRETLPELDPVFTEVIQTSQEVVRDLIGSEWKIRYNLETSLAGGVKWVSPGGGTVNLGSVAEPLRQSLVWGTQQSFPTAAESPAVGNIRLTLSMAKLFGNFYLPEDVFASDELSSSVVREVVRNIKGVAKRVAQQNIVWFYLPSTGELCTVSGISSYSGKAEITFTPDNGRIRWFYNGMVVDVYNQDFTTNRTSDFAVVVDNVDYLNKTVRLVRPDGTAFPAGFVNGDKVVAKDCYSSGKLGPYGLDDWTKSSGALFDASSGVNVSNYSQFKSLVSDISASLTESTLAEKMGQFVDAYGLYLDTVITTRGVTQGFMEQPTFGKGEFIFNRQGAPLNFVGGWSKVGFVYDGRNYQWLISPYMREETLYVVKLGGKNLKRYVPPNVPQMGSRADFGGEIRFLAGLGGGSGIFKLAHTSAGATQPMVEAPFISRCQMAPEIVMGIKLTSITESPAIATTTTTTTSTSTSTTSTTTTSTTTP